MSILTAQLTNSPIHVSENLFSLTITQHITHTAIDMEVYLPVVTMKNLPLTFDVLYSELPSILKSKCFNDDNIPFSTELKTTEMGHLFEHILLEYLCEEKVKIGYSVVEYSGETDWNWIKDPRGTFHITISTNKEDKEIFAVALQRTIKLFNIILNTEFYSVANTFSNKSGMNQSSLPKALSN